MVDKACWNKDGEWLVKKVHNPPIKQQVNGWCMREDNGKWFIINRKAEAIYQSSG